MMRDPAFGLQIPQQGTSCGIYATIIYYFTKALMRDRFFASCYAAKCKGTAMSISIPDKKWTTGRAIASCDLPTALMMRSFASDFCKWPANGNRPPWMQESK